MRNPSNYFKSKPCNKNINAKKVTKTAIYQVLPFIIAFISIIFITGIVKPAQSSPHSPGIMLSKQVRSGMRGYGLSVFKGTRIERFPIVVIGKLKHHISDADMILIRITGGYPVRARTGVIAGMSGSPIYINGRLIGAIGYGWPFAKSAIAGVTPIESMLREMPGKYKKTAGAKSSLAGIPDRSYEIDEPVYINGKKYEKAVISSGIQPDLKKYSGDTMVLSPVPSLLQLHGFSNESVKFVKKEFEPYGLVPVAIPGGGSVPKKAGYTIRPGSPIGVTFVEGDLFIGGTGTVTYRKGNDILAFGHPMILLGKTELPMNASYIQGIMPNFFRPFKFSSSMGIVGTLLEDRTYAVSGTLGRKPPMIPVMIDIIDKGRNTRKRYNIRCLQQKYLSPLLIALACQESLTPFASSLKESSVKIHYAMRLKDYEKIEFDDFSSSLAISRDSGKQIMEYLRDLTSHDFDPVKIEKLYFRITLFNESRRANIEEISTQLQKVSPGDNLDVNIRLRTDDGKQIIKKVTIPIPPDIRKGNVRIGVTGGSNVDMFEKKLLLLPLKPTSSSQIIHKVHYGDRGNDLVVQASFPRKTVTFAGERLSLLSMSKAFIFKSSPRSSVKMSKDTYKTRVKLPYFILGEEFINVGISKDVPTSQDAYENGNDGNEEKSPDTPQESNKVKTSIPARKQKLYNILSNHMETQLVSGKNSKKTKKGKKEYSTGSMEFSLSTPRDYFRGIFENTSITDGVITLGHKLNTLYFSKNPFIWAMDYDESTGIALIAESPTGYILEVAEGEKPRIVGKTGEMLVPCMTRDVSGNIYVGTAPYGRIYKRTPDREFKFFCKLDAQFVWDLKIDPSGNLLAATGNKGRIYRIDPSGKAQMLFDSPESHVQCLAIGTEGEIFAGTANQGVVFRISPTGDAKPIFRSIGNSIDSILYDNGTLWIASEELLYKLDNNGGKKVYIFPENSVITVSKDENGNILAGTSDLGRIYRISPAGKVENLFESDINQVMKITPLSGGDIIIATGNPGKVIRVSNNYNPSGKYLSGTIDTGRVSDFGNIKWEALTPAGSSVTLQTRIGDTSSPDSTWSKWSHAYSMKEGQKITGPSGRYIQIRANLTSSGKKTPGLYFVSIFSRHKNHAPLLAFESPKGGEKWSKSQEISWKAFIANPQTLSFSLYVSGDHGKTWKVLKENLNADIPKEGTFNPHKEKPIKKSYKWKTRSAKDGNYIIKLIGFDRTDPANKQLKSKITSRPVVIANKEPEVTIISSEEIDGRGVVTGFAKSHMVNVKQVTYKIDKGDTALAYPLDGIFDNTREKFVIYLNKPYKSRFKLKVKVIDEAGNSKTISKKISISKKK
ncbi:MAG: hypothetical protein K8T10_04200 [Candidatus Eremiobacteraeota bacterium]|nr:hypothetical protein [Candidatus Eremiobacteraeota bacterium]